MEGHSQLECNVCDLLNEANVILLLRTPSVSAARQLIQQMRTCADKAKSAGAEYTDAERRLRRAAVALEAKLIGGSRFGAPSAAEPALSRSA